MNKKEILALVDAAQVRLHARDDGISIWTVDLIGALNRTVDVEADSEAAARAATVAFLTAKEE